MPAKPHERHKPAARATPATALPATIGKYKVRALLGQGATSEVFLAHDEFRGIDVAIKRVRASTQVGPRDAKLQQHYFAAEAALVGLLQHPNVVQILDAFDDGEQPYLVMEYVQGTTLRRFCRADALLPLEQIVEIGFKCAMALGHVYRKGVIHRDVKPANIMARLDDGVPVDVKITDFGSAFNRAADSTQVYRVGSLAYMAPEQLEGDTLDCRADIYSLGAVLYHLIAGRPPFDATEQGAIMHQIFNAEPPSLMALRDGVSQRLDALVLAALAKEPAGRPATWDDFARSLSALVSDNEVPRSELQSMLDSERFTLLRRLEFFAGFGDVALWEVVHRASWQRLPVGHAIYQVGEEGDSFHVVAAGEVEVYRDGRCVSRLGAGTTVGEMAYLAPSPALRLHSVDLLVSQPATTVSFTPRSMAELSAATRHLFDKAFISVLVRRLHAAHEALAHPRRIL